MALMQCDIVRHRIDSSCVLAAVWLLVLGGCAEGVGLDEGGGYATLAPVEEDTQMWCTRLPSPLTCTDPDVGDGPNPWSCTVPPAVEKEVNEPPPTGGDPIGCGCAGPALDTALTALLSGGVAVVGDSEGMLLTYFRDAVYENAEERCEELVAAMNPLPDFNNCDFAVAQHLYANPGDFPPLYKEGSVGDCVAGANYGEDETAMGVEPLPPDDYSDYYNLSSVITFNTIQQKYIIDGTFFHDMRENPGWLFSDGTRFAPTSTNDDYQLTGVSSGTIAHALGLQNGDRPRTINGHSVTTIGEMLAAYEALRNATSFTFVIRRGSSNVTLSYEIDL
jgi:hypothetical protein